jgi:hypothetical protein
LPRRINSAASWCDGVLDAGQCTCQTHRHHEAALIAGGRRIFQIAAMMISLAWQNAQ